MNYKTATTEKVKTCKKCGITKSVQTEFLSGYGSCKECMYEKQRDYAKRSANKGVPQKRESEKIVKREYELLEIYEMPPYLAYVEAVRNVFTPDEWLTLKQIHERIGELFVRREWTLDALTKLSDQIEPRGVQPTRYRLKETAAMICRRVGHMVENNNPKCPRCGKGEKK